MLNSASLSRCFKANSSSSNNPKMFLVIPVGTSRIMKMVCSRSHLERYLILAEIHTAHCSDYLCPGTLGSCSKRNPSRHITDKFEACVSVPHHCPCAHPNMEDKVELGEGSAICVSRGGFKEGEAARKIELARKGLL